MVPPIFPTNHDQVTNTVIYDIHFISSLSDIHRQRGLLLHVAFVDFYSCDSLSQLKTEGIKPVKFIYCSYSEQTMERTAENSYLTVLPLDNCA